MIKFLVTTGSTHTFKFKMTDLIENSLADLVENKYPGGTVTKVEGDKATVVVGGTEDVMIDPAELITNTAESIIKKRLKTRKKLVITVGKK